MAIRIALAGNPNTGKTTLFNALTGSAQHVGNWPGVTVEKKDGKLKADRAVIIEDLPGIYSLSPYTMEEVVSRRYLIDDKPDAILNIVDASNLERNLYLTTQLAELGIPVVLALNMMDIVEKNGDVIDASKLGEMLGCEVVEISALRERGIDDAAKSSVATAGSGAKMRARHHFSERVERALADIAGVIGGRVPDDLERWTAIKLFERDKEAFERVELSEDERARIEEITKSCEADMDDDAEGIITSERYIYVSSVSRACLKRKSPGGQSTSDKIDSIVTNRVLALPIFAAIMFVVYYLSINTIGGWGTDWVNDVLFGEIIPERLGGWMASADVSPLLQSLVMDGIVAGVGSVLGFLPQMLVLFFCLAILEDCGYMARIAFVLDRVFRKFGLSGKSFIPVLIATGCGVPGIMGSRTIESDSDRRLTIMTTTFMPCSAKLPVIALLAAAMFGEGGWWVGPMSYFLGMTSIVIVGIMLKKTRWFASDPTPFVIELPAYHFPGIKGVLRTMYERGASFVKKAGSLILIATILIWALQGFNWRMEEVEAEESMLADIGHAVEPLFVPLGWSEHGSDASIENGWRAAVASISGLIAKENVVGTLGVLYGIDEGEEEEEEVDPRLANVMHAAFPTMAGLSFLIFNLLCAPCFAAMGAMRREMMNGALWVGAIAFQCVYAYAVAMMVYQFGSLAYGGSFGVGTACAAFVAAIGLYMLFIKRPYKREAAQGLSAAPAEA